jgi:hypothetical protein
VQHGDQIGRHQRAELDLNRAFTLVVEQLERVEILVGDGNAEPKPEDLVHRRSRLSAHTSTTADFNRRRTAGHADARANGAEIDLGLFNPLCQRQSRLQHAVVCYRTPNAQRPTPNRQRFQID